MESAFLRAICISAAEKRVRGFMRSHPSFSFRYLILIHAFLYVIPAWGDGLYDSDMSGFTLRGFGTLGAAKSSSEQADFVRDLSQPDGTRGNWSSRTDSILGVQGNYQFNDQFEGVAQLVSRYRYDRSYRPELSWMFLKYDPDPGISLRLGRVGTEFYMLADSRHVGYSYLPVRPPTDYFSALPIYYMNGGDLTLTLPLSKGLAKIKAFYGVGDEKIPISDWTWDFTGSPIIGGYLDIYRGSWQWRLSYAQLKFKNDFPISNVRGALRSTGVPSAVALSDALTFAGQAIQFYSIGASYDSGPLQAQIMLSRARQESKMFETTDALYSAGECCVLPL